MLNWLGNGFRPRRTTRARGRAWPPGSASGRGGAADQVDELLLSPAGRVAGPVDQEGELVQLLARLPELCLHLLLELAPAHLGALEPEHAQPDRHVGGVRRDLA